MHGFLLARFGPPTRRENQFVLVHLNLFPGAAAAANGEELDDGFPPNNLLAGFLLGLGGGFGLRDREPSEPRSSSGSSSIQKHFQFTKFNSMLSI